MSPSRLPFLMALELALSDLRVPRAERVKLHLILRRIGFRE